MPTPRLVAGAVGPYVPPVVTARLPGDAGCLAALEAAWMRSAMGHGQRPSVVTVRFTTFVSF